VGEVAEGDRSPHVEGLDRPADGLVLGIAADGVVEGEGVGEVE